MDKNEKVYSIILCIVGIIIVIDGILAQFFNVGIEQNYLVMAYSIAFVLLTSKYKNLLKKQYVVFPLYIMIAQMIYSLFIK